MKKTLALVLAFALVFSTMTVAFAEDAAAIGADAKVCSDLGMLKGATGTVDAAYLATVPNRLQAAVMFLRLKGLEAEANAFTGTDSFSDASKATWGQPVMAYLKAHPELGFEGNPDGTFAPAGVMTAQAYYKVLLTALGYKQNTATVVGDFTWENVMTFAATKGLTKNAAVTNFTVNDLAVGTVEALKATVKDTTKTLVATLIEAGKIDKAAATTAGVFVDNATSTAKLSEAKAVANDKVKVTFDADASADYASNLANYKIIVKGSTTALEVKSATVVSPAVVELTTAAQTAGTAYTLTVADVTLNFAGIAKESGAPELDTVSCYDTNTVEVKYTKALDKASAEDVANYTIAGATVVKAELWEDTFSDRKVVKLTTDGIANNKIYKLKVANVKSADLVAIKTVEKSFAGVTDTTAPKIDGNVIVKNNQRIIVNFSGTHGVDKATVENIANWNIDGLKINSITAKEQNELDDYTVYDQVEVNTEAMTPNQKYTVEISNLIDGSVSKNAISKSLTKTFYGVAVDKTAPKAGAITVLGDSMLEVVFTENNRIDTVSATDINNYTLTDGLKVLSAKILKTSKPDEVSGKTVVLTTSTMDKDTTYKITIENVADEFGNVMSTVSNRSLARSLGADIKPPVVQRVVWVDDTTVKVYFNERLDMDTANDPANFVISGGIGVVKEAALSSSESNDYGPYSRVTLTTAKMAANTGYTVTVNNVKDRLGNVMSEYKVGFTSGITEADTDRPEIESISAENNGQVRITFNEKLAVLASAAITVDGNSDGDTSDVLEDFTGTVVGVEGWTGSYDYVYTIDEGTTVVFKTNKPMKSTGEMTITALTGISDRYKNTYKIDPTDKPTFYGSTTANDAAEVDSIDQVDARTLKFVFNEPILDKTLGRRIFTIPGSVDGSSATYTAKIDTDKDYTTDALSTLTVTTTSKFAYDKTYKFTLSSALVDYNGLAVKDLTTTTSTDYRTFIEDKDGPVIDYVEPINVNLLHVVFNESIDTPGTYEVQKSDGTRVAGGYVSCAVNADDDTIVDVTIDNSKLTIGDVYKLVPKTYAYDLSSNHNDIKDMSFEFVQSGVLDKSWIKGVRIYDARTIKVYTTNNIATTALINVYREDADGNDDKIVYTGNPNAAAGTSALLPLTESLRDSDTTYRVRIFDNNVSYNELYTAYEFSGISNDGGIDNTGAIATFSGWDTTNYVVKVVYDMNGNGKIDTAETYLVMPVGGNFVLGTVYSEANTANTLNLTTQLLTGDTYGIEVYRTTSTISLTGVISITDYTTAISGNVEGAVLYTKEVTK